MFISKVQYRYAIAYPRQLQMLGELITMIHWLIKELIKGIL